MRHRQPLAGDRASEYGKTLAEANHREGIMGDLEIVTTADRHDLDEQARDAFRPGWPEFIFHDPISAEHVGRVEAYFPQYDVLLLDEGEVVAGGWGVPMRWDGTVSTLPDGYDGALISALTGHETSVPADTLCIMAAAVRADRLGSGWRGRPSPRSAREPPARGCRVSSHQSGQRSRAGIR